MSVAALPRVLIAEDDDAIRVLLSAALRKAELHVDAVADGLQALRMCEAHEYAVILLDLMMPVLSGFGFLDAFAAASPAARSVVFVITAYDDRMFANLSAERVHAIVRKPFNLGSLVATVRETALAWSAQTRPERERTIERSLPVRVQPERAR